MNSPHERPCIGLVTNIRCHGNPGHTAYRGINLFTGKVEFAKQLGWATNTIVEFIAIVHALATVDKLRPKKPVYSNSENAINWIRKNEAYSRYLRDPRAEIARTLVSRAEKWLREHPDHATVQRWKTDLWGHPALIIQEHESALINEA